MIATRLVSGKAQPCTGSRAAPASRTPSRPRVDAFYLGLGDKLDMKKATALPAGGFHFLPGKARHYAFSKGPTVVQLNGNGPFDMTYLNPADDPQKKM